LDISRVISDQEESESFGIRRRESVTARLRAELDLAEEDDRVRAVVLRINSPGGSVTASDIVYHDLMAFRARRRIPLIAQMLDLGTSGAYYIALAADEIVAAPTTVTGSIGVVMYGVSLAGLMDKLGVSDQTVKTGSMKDMSSPLRTRSAAEDAVMQGVLDDMQARFLALVRERRPAVDEATLQTVSDGRILTADQALRGRLIDRIGYLEDSIGVARARAGVSEATIVMYRRADETAENIHAQTAAGPAQVNLINFDLGGLQAAPQFLYMWLPSSTFGLVRP
jgi:protease-4